jgi:acyl-CoA reductase-like NAD-dependent aldehyde dehydrogenase
LPQQCPLRSSIDNCTSFINNEFVKSVDGQTIDVINPSTEEVICQVAEATEKDVDIAVAAARKAFNGPWRKETPENRGKLLVKLADLFEENAELIAAVEALDNGKAYSMAKNIDVAAAASCLRYYGGWADKIEGKVVDTTPDTFNYIRKEPVSTLSLTPKVIQLTLSDRCLRSDYPLELPYPHVGMEDWPCRCHR